MRPCGDEHHLPHQDRPSEEVFPASAEEAQPACDGFNATFIASCLYRQGHRQTAVYNLLCWEGKWLQSNIAAGPSTLILGRADYGLPLPQTSADMPLRH